MRRFLILFCSVLISFCLGGVYAWSAFVPALQKEFGLSALQCQVVFGLTIAIFTIAMVPAGRLLGRLAPRFLAGAGGLLLAAGYVIASASGGDFRQIVLGVGVVGGVGIGLAYVVPIAVCLRWFPNHRGLITGLTVCGFGAGGVGLSAIVGSMQEAGVATLGIFRLVGLVYACLVIPASMALAMPDDGTAASWPGRPSEPLANLVRTRAFLVLALGIFCGTFAGLLVIGNLRSIGLSAGVAPAAAMMGISLFAVGNAAGRITWGLLVDRFGRVCMPVSLLVLAGAIILKALPGSSEFLFLSGALVCGFAFGACFVVYAAQVSERFGVDVFASLYPLVFLFYGLSGVLGPVVGGFVFDATGSYVPAMALAVAVALAGAAGTTLLDRSPAAWGQQVEPLRSCGNG